MPPLFDTKLYYENLKCEFYMNLFDLPQNVFLSIISSDYSKKTEVSELLLQSFRWPLSIFHSFEVYDHHLSFSSVETKMFPMVIPEGQPSRQTNKQRDHQSERLVKLYFNEVVFWKFLGTWWLSLLTQCH